MGAGKGGWRRMAVGAPTRCAEPPAETRLQTKVAKRAKSGPFLRPDLRRNTATTVGFESRTRYYVAAGHRLARANSGHTPTSQAYIGPMDIDLVDAEAGLSCAATKARAHGWMTPREKLCATGWDIDHKGCWIWRGTKDPNGRPRVSVKGRREYAYRTMWAVVSGAPVPATLQVCHACDDPSCIRPTHLFLGSHADNMADAASKHRMTGAPKITNAQVEAIRAVWAAGGVTQRAIAVLYGIDHVTVNRIIKGRARTTENRAA